MTIDRLSDKEDIRRLKELIYRHIEHTDSQKARTILEHWPEYEPVFWAVVPKPVTPPPGATSEVEKSQTEPVAKPVPASK